MPAGRVNAAAGDSPRAAPRIAAAAVCLAAGSVASAQTSVASSITVREVITQSSGAGRGSDAITEVSPAISVSRRSGQLQGSLNYSASGTVHARDSSDNALRHSLAARANAQLVPQRFGVDAAAGISQQIISPFGVQTADPALSNANRTQVATYSISPYLQGRLLGEVGYQARLTYAGSHSQSTAVGDTSSLSGSVGLSGGFGRFGWTLSASRFVRDVPGFGSQISGQNGVGLTFQPDIDWQFSARAGQEVNNIRTGRNESTTSWGGGVRWRPGPRTDVNVNWDRRFFGRSHSVTVSHRMARTIVTFSDSRSLSQGGVNGAATMSLYELYFALYASQEPDEARRDAYIRSLLASQGLNPNAVVVIGGFLTSSSSVQRQQVLSLAYQGLRSTVSFSASRSRSSLFGTQTAPGDPLAQANSIGQRGYTITFSHRLTPSSSFSVTGSQQRADSVGTTPGTDLKSIVSTWSESLGRRSSVSVSVRYSTFDSATNPYHESALIGSFSHRF